MASVPNKQFTVDEYFAIEYSSSRRYEYCQGDVFAMTGASVRHNRIFRNLLVAVHALLRDSGQCEVFGSDQRIAVEVASLYTYPDLVIACNPTFERETLTNPRVIFEILSNSTERYDRGRKFQLYRTSESLEEYILVSQHEARCERYVRQEDGSWSLTESAGTESLLPLVSIKSSLAMGEIYRGIEFNPEIDAEDGNELRLRLHPDEDIESQEGS